MKIVHVRTVWKATHELEVPDDWEWDGSLGALVEFDELSSQNAELVDYEIERVVRK